MKMTPRYIAQALYDVTKDKSEKEIKEIINNFFKFLNQKSLFKLTDRIIEKYIEIYNKNEGIMPVEVKSSKQLSSQEESAIKEKVKTITQADKIELNNVVNPEMIGGVILNFDNKVIDLSIKNYLNKLKNKIKQ